jgi:putative nucleotidyltransferase with HDIG domain
MCMTSRAAGVPAPDGVRLGRYLPLSVGVTLSVTVLPLLAVSQLGPARNPLGVALHVLLAVALSMLVARVLSVLWTRHQQSSDLVFGDLLLWGWALRALAERRLEATAREMSSRVETGEERIALLQRMSTLLEARDPYTHGHSRRVARHAERIAREMGLPREQVAKIRAAALVHDIGKINVPRSILTKPGRLTDEEFALVKRHPGDGAAMVVELEDPQLTAIVRHHHERMDGTGYPDGLAGGDIPLGARVIAVADTFDAITSTRAYRKSRTHEKALEVLRAEAGTQLDPGAVAAFVSYYAARRSVGFATFFTAAPQRLLSGLGGVQSGVAASVAPIAQTACGVGGLALLGACLGGSGMPASNKIDPDRGVSQLIALHESRPAAEAGAPGKPDRGRSVTRDTRPAAPNDRASTPTPSDRTAPRSLETPDTPDTEARGGGQADSGGGGGGGGDTLPPAPDVTSSLPDVGAVLEPVTDSVPLPPLPLPTPVPSVSLP